MDHVDDARQALGLNTFEEATAALLDTAFEPTEEEYMTEDQLVDTVFGHFITPDRPREEVVKMVTKVSRAKWGKPIVRKRGQHHHMGYHFKDKINMAEGKWVQPAKSRVISRLEEIKYFPSGSKIEFTRRSTLHGELADIYSHTGLILHTGANTIVVELQKKDGRPRVVISPAEDCLKDVANSTVVINNLHLAEGGVFLKDVLYRLSWLLGAAVRYDATRCNCDVVATFLQVLIFIHPSFLLISKYLQ